MMTELLPMDSLDPCVLTIAGSDSGAGAGIQADLKTFAAHGVFGLSVLTMVTAQNTQRVDMIDMVSESTIQTQLEAVFDDFRISAAKTGALGNTETVSLVSRFLSRVDGLKLVVDPVMISKHGDPLIAEEAVPAIITELLPLAEVVTPNLPEAARLAEIPEITDRKGMLAAADRIRSLGCRNVVIKGGHSSGDPVDLLWDGIESVWLDTERIDSCHTHGTGCTFSAAIAANLASGKEVPDAVVEAKSYITGAIRNARMVGRGINPVNHFWH